MTFTLSRCEMNEKPLKILLYFKLIKFNLSYVIRVCSLNSFLTRCILLNGVAIIMHGTVFVAMVIFGHFKNNLELSFKIFIVKFITRL